MTMKNLTVLSLITLAHTWSQRPPAANSGQQ